MAFRLPTRVDLRPGCRADLPDVLGALGARRVLLVVDPGLATTPWPEGVLRATRAAGIAVEVDDGVEPNPRVATVERLAQRAREEQRDVLVGLGGGSVLDAAKAAAMLAENPQPIGELIGRNRFHNVPRPFVAVPTTCGTGSEVTWVSVLSEPQTRRKVSVKGDGMFPRHALVDAELLSTLPASLVAWTGLDALTHALEALTCRLANPISDALAEKAIELLLSFLPRAAADIAGDGEARREVARASTTAGIAFGNADVAAVHCLSETLGGFFDLPHGLLNAILLVPVLRSHRPAIDPVLARLAVRLWGGRESDDGPERVLATLDGLNRALEVPSFVSLGVPTEAHQAIAEGAVANGSNDSNPRPMGVGEYRAILQELTDDDPG